MSIPILTGTTASGKTAIALELARQFRKNNSTEIEIINADSMLVYRGMTIGSAKPTTEELAEITHHLIDIRNPDEPFTAGDFLRNVEDALKDIQARGNTALIVGGTGFYLKALLFGLWETPAAAPEIRAKIEATHPENQTLFELLNKLDPISAERIGKSDRYRLVRALEIIEQTGKTPSELQAEHSKIPDSRFKLFILDRSPSELDLRIKERTRIMLAEGFIEETKTIKDKTPLATSLRAVGYRQICDHLDNKPPQGRKKTSLEDEINLATRQLVKKQRTFFKGLNCGHWFQLPEQNNELIDSLRSVLAE